jgi:glyoxylase-like metal-dependent hydrolase (beta-lactamase superfamily II)
VTTAWICATCGVQHPPSLEPPLSCAICDDERQYVPAGGQRWTSLAALETEGRRNVLEPLEPGLTQIRTEPSFAIGQQAYLVQTPAGNVLWDCVSYLDDATVSAVRALGGVAAIAISHPHFYSSCVEWAHAFGATVWLPAADRGWVMRPDPSIRHVEEDSVSPVEGVRLVRVGGHFRGSTVLLWPAGGEGRGVLLTGDTIATVADPRSVSIMYSYPNRIPLSAREVRDVGSRVLALEFDRLYAGWDGDVISAGAHEVVERSFERYARIVEGSWPRA